MVKDKELEIRLSFLEEAQDYLNTIESGIMIATARQDRQQMDAVLRAAHSIKGGAAMMGFPVLSDLAHRLEDFFKVLKTQQSLDAELESLLLASVGCLRQAIAIYHQGDIDEQWQENHVTPIFSQLEQRLGSVSIDSPDSLLPEDGQMQTLVFETEVEEYLQRLESILADPQHPGLLEETIAIAQDFASLGQMFQIPAFQSLCESISQNLAASPERVVEIASLALQEWRQAQAAILLNRGTLLSTPDSNDTLAAQAEIEAFLDLLSPELTQENYQSEFTPTLASIDPQQLQNTEKKSLHLASESSLETIEKEKTVRVSVELLEQLNDLFGELTIERNGVNLYIDRLKNLVKILDGRVHTLKNFDTRLLAAYENNYSHNAAYTFDTRDNREENSFTNQIIDENYEIRAFTDEVMESIFRIQEVTNDISISIEDTAQTVSELNRTAKQMQSNLTQVRMRPLSDLLNRFPRFLRELSLQYNKKVELKIQGGETLIERNILEALNDPLLHLLRNAFDHGIEDPYTRQARGKPEQGTIEIKATSGGNQTFISISDDGQGIDLTKVRAKAQQLGLNSTALANASEKELLTLIFEPGFSTASQITSLSGRGVGLDIVRTNLRKIRGDIKVDTHLGIGTTFHLNIPITLSIAKVILVESNNMLIAFPTDAIEEMLLLNSEHITTIAGRELFSWEGNTIPLLRLGEWLVFRGAYKSEAATVANMGVPTILKVFQGHELVAVQVDRCWGEQEVAIRQVEGAIAMPPGFSSCTILGDGRVVPLVNPSALLQWIASCQQSALAQTETLANTHQSHKDTILVVDDSINVRRFLSLALEKAGYRVEEAIDGQDAIEKLFSGLPVKVVISDVDMPRLDGYSLLAQVKSVANLKQLPFIILTSRQGQRERQLAKNLGAAAYFSKPFNEQELLQTIQLILINS
jgi:chemosensory pili system protein ChpA (sensor histidine kinase/response regulator)